MVKALARRVGGTSELGSSAGLKMIVKISLKARLFLVILTVPLKPNSFLY